MTIFRLFLLLLFSSTVLLGCATSPERTARHAMIDAQASIATGQTIAGLEYLAESYTLPDPDGVTASFGTLLDAEIQLREGHPERAVALAEQVLRTGPTNPLAREVAGKARLMTGGPFDVAEEHFLVARDHYRDAADIERVVDLLSLARGFSAYSTGDLELAQSYWRAIVSHDLRYTLDRATRETLRESSERH